MYIVLRKESERLISTVLIARRVLIVHSGVEDGISEWNLAKHYLKRRNAGNTSRYPAGTESR